MRSLFLLMIIFVMLFHSLGSHAQSNGKVVTNMTFGLKLGLNMQEMEGGTTYETAYKRGLTTGAFISVNRRKHGIRVEAALRTARFYYLSYPRHTNTTSLDVPILYEVKVMNRLWLQFGPQYSGLIKARRYGYGDNNLDVKNRFRNSDLSAVAGLEVTLPYHLIANVRYVYGLVNVNNTSYIQATPESWRNKAIQISVGYRFY